MTRSVSPSRRRASLPILACGLLVAAAGCEAPDDTIRGAGSIDVPLEPLHAQPAPADATARPIAPMPEPEPAPEAKDAPGV